MRVFACVCVHSLWCDTRRLAREGPSHVRAPVWLGLEKFLSFEFLRFLAAQLFSPKRRMAEQAQHVINEATFRPRFHSSAPIAIAPPIVSSSLLLARALTNDAHVRRIARGHGRARPALAPIPRPPPRRRCGIHDGHRIRAASSPSGRRPVTRTRADHRTTATSTGKGWSATRSRRLSGSSWNR